jgi:hypothetical protein
MPSAEGAFDALEDLQWSRWAREVDHALLSRSLIVGGFIAGALSVLLFHHGWCSC